MIRRGRICSLRQENASAGHATALGMKFHVISTTARAVLPCNLTLYDSYVMILLKIITYDNGVRLLSYPAGTSMHP